MADLKETGGQVSPDKADEAFKLSRDAYRGYMRSAGVGSLITVLLSFLSIATNLRILTSGTIKLGFAEVVVQESFAVRIFLLTAAISAFAYTTFMAHFMMISGDAGFYATKGSPIAGLFLEETEYSEKSGAIASGTLGLVSGAFMVLGPIVMVTVVIGTFVYSVLVSAGGAPS